MRPKSHNILTLASSSEGLPKRAINIPVFILALLVMGLNLYNLFKDEPISNALALAAFLTALMGGLVFFVRKANYKLTISVNAEWIRCTESGGITRSAYFSQLHSIELRKNRIYMHYSSGHKEQFPLPAYSDEEFEMLQSLLEDAAENHSFAFDLERGWLYFTF